MTIKFNKFYITNGKIKSKVHYSFGETLFINNEIIKKNHVTIYEKDYSSNLSKIFSGVVNESDSMTDYFENDRIRFDEGSQFYEEALKRTLKSNS